MMNNRAFCIVGPPRSGTSLVAHAAIRMGVNFGREEDMMAAVGNMNEDGLYEHKIIAMQHYEILKTFRRTFNTTMPLPENWLENPTVANARKTLTEWVLQDFSQVPSWGWKDPRACSFLPLWTEMARELGFSLHLIIPFRNPVDVAHSLYRMYGVSQEQAFRAWLYMMLELREFANSCPHHFICYDDFFADPDAGIRDLMNFVGAAGGDEMVTTVRQLIRPGLRHSHTSDDELLEIAGPELAALYQECRGKPPPPTQRRLFHSLADFQGLGAFIPLAQCEEKTALLRRGLFYDKGNGFNLFDCLLSIIPHGFTGVLEINERYQLPPVTVRGLRFSPCQGAPSRCRIDSVETDGSFVKAVAVNSKRQDDTDLFSEGESLYELQGDFSKATYVHFRGWIEIDDPVAQESQA